MNRTLLSLALLLALLCGIVAAEEKGQVDWEAAYQQLLQSDPGVQKKIESGQATKEDVIRWLKDTRENTTKVADWKSAHKRDLTAFHAKLAELVKSGKLTQEDATKLAATMGSTTARGEAAKPDDTDWDATYEKLLQNPAIRQKIEQGGSTKEQVIEYLKKQAAAKRGKGKLNRGRKTKPGGRKGSVNFYAIVIGKLKSKDIELGELELEVDYVLSESNWAKQELVGQRVRLVGVAGAFLDNLLRIKRGQTIKVRTGDYNPETKVLGFGYKFQVLERTTPFDPESFGVPPQAFRGYHGELVGKVIEASGYEVLLEVQESKAAKNSQAKDAASIHGKRIRIAGFYNQHAEAFADLHEGDKIRVSVAHRKPSSDAVNVTNVLQKVVQ